MHARSLTRTLTTSALEHPTHQPAEINPAPLQPSAVTVSATSGRRDIIFAEQHFTCCSNLPLAPALGSRAVMWGQISPDTQTPYCRNLEGFFFSSENSDSICQSPERLILLLRAAAHRPRLPRLSHPWDPTIPLAVGDP